MKKNLTKGFTLIELLVVIAIIGILASVILASLDSARAKGIDAATKSDLSNAMAQAELFYDNGGNTYSLVCSASGGVITMMSDAATKSATSYTYTTSTAGSTALTVCHDSANAWAAEVPLKTPGSAFAYYCVDNTGKEISTNNVLGASVYACS